MSERKSSLPPNVTLEMVYDAVRDVANGIQESRQLWGEAEKNILKLIAFERRRVDEHELSLERLRVEDQDHDSEIAGLRKRCHEINNKLTPIFTNLEEVGRLREDVSALSLRIGALEKWREQHAPRDTQLRPPPPEDADG